jgi:uncharacterized Zn finger protein
MSWYSWKPYVPVMKRKANAAAYSAKIAKKEKRTLTPIKLTGRSITSSFWGKAWCDNLEGYSDFENRLPRGRTYVRNGSVVDLQIERGKIKAIVSGSDIYRITIDIDTVSAATWSRIKKDCARSIDSLIDLLQGRFDKGIMERLTRRHEGLFPDPDEIRMKCSCPDWAYMCKHVAAALYGVGSRLDVAPELLFTLRNVDHLDLIDQAVDTENLDHALKDGAPTSFADSNLGEIFGIDLDTGNARSPLKGADTVRRENPAHISGKLLVKKLPVKAKKALGKISKSKAVSASRASKTRSRARRPRRTD